MNNLLNNLGLAPAATLTLELRPPPGGGPRPTALLRPRGGGDAEPAPLYVDGDTVAGEIRITPAPGKRLDHAGIKIRLLGRIELSADAAGAPRTAKHDFLTLVRDLAPPGTLTSTAVLPFEFGRVDLPHESYTGRGVRLRYQLKASVSRAYAPALTREWALAVQAPRVEPPPPEGGGSGVPASPGGAANGGGPPPLTAPVRLEVGIEDCLHIELAFDRGAYGLGDTVLGRVNFLLVRIKLKHMDLELRRRETTGAGAAARSEAETVARFEIMDGAPVRGESVPVRMSLAPYDLTPTYRNVHNKFSVRYFLNLVLVDDEDRRYFKQTEVVLWRRAASVPPPPPPPLGPVGLDLIGGGGGGGGSAAASPEKAGAESAAGPAAVPAAAG